jgi:uncharacterized protein (TIGR03382 family)
MISPLLKILLVSGVATSQVAPLDTLGPRRVMHWESLAHVPASNFSGRVRVKFHDGIQPRVVDTHTVVDEHGTLLLDTRTAPLHIVEVHPLLDIEPLTLRKIRLAAQARCHCQVADMSTYVELTVDARASDVEAWMPALNALKGVEVAYPAPGLVKPPVDIPPTTPTYAEGQTYHGPAPDGLGVSDVRSLPGGDGAGIQVADMEVDWITTHEDLAEKCEGSQIPDVGTIYPGLEYVYYAAHGTAVLSMLVAPDNGYGVTGFAPAAGCNYTPEYTTQHGTSAARALLAGFNNGVLSVGDVILMESQTGGPSWDGMTDQGLVPTEWEPATFDAVRTLTTSGVVVVAAAGNGYENLDDAKFNQAFDRAHADSGAIIVGAGTPPGTPDTPRSRLYFSNWGSRVDVQGWGDRVVSAGYGDLFGPNSDVNQYYSAEFAGTSSASPMVTGSAVLLQAIQQAGGGTRLTGMELRALLVATGTAQDGDTSQHIGPQPNLPAAVLGLTVCGNARQDRLEVCEDGNTADGDGCSANCKSTEVCGNGILDQAVGEICDDGNTADGDGCSASCRSNETCGNGVVDTAAGEECDDGNTKNFDRCNKQCKKMPPWSCQGSGGGGVALAVLAGAWLVRRRARR